MGRVLIALIVIVCLSLLSVTSADAQTNRSKQTNLVSDVPGMAPVIDSNLVNPCGICIIPENPFWISDNASAAGVTSLYTRTGAQQGPFTIAPPKGSSNPATPMGCVANADGGFGLGGSRSPERRAILLTQSPSHSPSNNEDRSRSWPADSSFYAA